MTTLSTRMLETARRGELHHAIILHGPSMAALRELSVRLAKTLNCTQGSTGDDCMSCQRIDRRIHPDVHFIEVGGEKKMISIDQIRDLVENATMRPYEGRTKVFIVDPADGMTPGGANSLLKTLEEPPRDTNFILLTRSPDLLLPTIRSRSQWVYVGDTRRALTGPRESLRARQVALLDDGDELAAGILDLLHRWSTRGESAALLAVAALVSNHDDPKDALALLGSILCDLVALDPRESLDPKKLADIRAHVPPIRLLAAADASLAAIRNLAVNADVRLLAEQVVSALV
ncbi:MAG TPA: DNA polymerase III subunit [Thermoanaerobaculia bacterium]